MEKEMTKKKKKKASSSREEVPVPKSPSVEQDSRNIRDAKIDGQHVNVEEERTCDNLLALSDISLDCLEITLAMEENGNNDNIQETALTEAVVTAPTAPVLEDSSAALDLPTPAETIPPIVEVPHEIQIAENDTFPAIVYNDFVPLSEANLMAMYENRELSVWKDYLLVLAETRCLTSTNRLVHERIHFLSKLRDVIEADSVTLDNFKMLASFQMDNVWSFEKRMVTETGECQDGNPVTAEHDYVVSHFDGAGHVALTSAMNSIKKVCYENMVLNLHLSELMKDFMAKYVDSICNPCLGNIALGSPALLRQECEPDVLKVHVDELRTCIGILCKFLRCREDDDLFSRFIIELLEKVVGIFVRVATWKDHMFLLQQVLDSPSKIPVWMINFVQVPMPLQQRDPPPSPFSCRHLDHLVTVLSVLMSPVERRHTSIGHVPDTANVSWPSLARAGNERDFDLSSWMIVDSDGEENETDLNEEVDSDGIIELFNQLPLQEMYAHILKVDRDPKSKYVINLNTYDDRYMVELFAFSTVLIRLYEKGLHTYGKHLYLQFAKRLGQLIKHTVQYVTDAFGCYRDTINSTPALWKLQCEYDMVVIRAVNAIYSSKDLGIWQFLATMPYNLISRNASWKIFYMLFVEYDSDIERSMPRCLGDWMDFDERSSMYQVLEDRLCALPESDAMYLLSALSSMALPKHASCDEYRQFTQTLTHALFRIGFMSDLTQDRFSKHIRTQLAAVTTVHPWLISTILYYMPQYNFIKSERLCLDLFNDLPLMLWMPNGTDIGIIRRWLREKPLLSVEFSLTRLILNNLNYNMTDNNEQDLVIGHNVHCHLALLVAEAAIGFTGNQGITVPNTNAGVLNEMLTKMSGSGNGLEIAYKWAWGLQFRLRVHMVDRGGTIPKHAICDPARSLQSVLDLFATPELQNIANGVLQRHPMACFLALSLTTWGHSVPLICAKGFPLITDVFLKNQLHREAIALLHLLVPMFLNCTQSLILCDAFHSILVALCSADKGFLRLARSLLVSDQPGPVLRMTAAMIESHLNTADGGGYGQNGLENMITMWLGCLAKVPEWVNNNSVLFLMDIILRKAFFHWHPRISATLVLNQELVAASHPLETQEVINTTAAATLPEFLIWMKDQLFPPFKSLMSQVSLPHAPWFATFVLLAERDWQEGNQLWPVIQVVLYKGATNIDCALKKAIKKIKFQATMSTGNLAIYRWANQAVDMPIEHPLVPFIWHIFFMLYLARVPADPEFSAGGVGNKFFEQAVNQKTIRKIKKQLLDTASHYTSCEAEMVARGNGDPARLRELDPEITRLAKLARLFKTYHLWLEDPRLMRRGDILSQLEPMYDIPRLTAVFNGDECPGREFVRESDVKECQLLNLTTWEKTLNRFHDPGRRNYPIPSEVLPDRAEERILKRLRSYDAPKKPPEVPLCQNRLPEGVWREFQHIILPRVDESLKILKNSAEKYNIDMSEYTAADCSIHECLPLIYSNVQCERTLTAMCHSSPPHRGTNYHARESTCAGQAEMRVLVTESQVSNVYKKCFEDSRKDWLACIDSALHPPSNDTCAALVAIEDVVKNIIEEKNSDGTSNNSCSTEEAGVTLLFHLLSNFTAELEFFPPTRQILLNCMRTLASEFLKGGYHAERFLVALLDDLRLARVLSAYLHPCETSTHTFIRMYGIMAEKAYVARDCDAFGFILAQFDVPGWINFHHSSVADCSELIAEIAKVLSAAGLQPDESKDKLTLAFRKDLTTLLLYKFPENFGNILSHLLRASAIQRISLDVWYDFINTFMQNNKIHLGMEMPKLRDEIRQFANEQTTLPYLELVQTSKLLSTYFLAERNKYGLYGLYPKYRTYVEPIMAFQALIGHMLTVASLANEEGQLSMIICCKLWQSLEAMYSPWIMPLWTEQLEEPVPSWIEMLTEDRSVMLPWIPPDKQHASRAVMMFVEGVRFILESVSVDVLAHLWEYYVANFAHNSVPEHVLLVIHAHFETLPWQQFCPTSLDMDLMFKVITVSVPAEVHSFLGTIFVNVAWSSWLTYATNVYKNNIDHLAKFHVYLLHLHVKMAKEKEVRKKSKITAMLSIAKKFDWHLVDAASYGPVVDWWVFKYDSRVAAGLSEPYINPIDKCVMTLLEAAAGFTTEVQPLHPTTLYKRVFYVRGVIKMLMRCTSDDRAILDKNVHDVSGVIYALLSSIENITQRTVPEEHRLTECTLLVKEVIGLFLATDELKKLALKICVSWLQKENCMSYVVQGFLGVLGTDVISPAIMCELLETCFTAYFKNTVVQESPPSWSNAAKLLSPPVIPNVEETLLTSGYFLTLHALLFKQIAETKSVGEESTLLNSLVDWICQVKPSGLVESKLPLLWGIALLLIHRQCQFNENLVSVSRIVRRLITHFTDMGEEKGQFWSLLGSLGLRKSQVLSLKGRLLCRAMAAFLLAQMPDGSSEQVMLRVKATSPGAITECRASVEGVPLAVASGDAVRALRDLESLVGSKSHVEMKDTIELAIKLIKDPTQTVNTAKEVLGALTADLYTEQYLHILTAFY